MARMDPESPCDEGSRSACAPGCKLRRATFGPAGEKFNSLLRRLQNSAGCDRGARRSDRRRTRCQRFECSPTMEFNVEGDASFADGPRSRATTARVEGKCYGAERARDRRKRHKQRNAPPEPPNQRLPRKRWMIRLSRRVARSATLFGIGHGSSVRECPANLLRIKSS